MKRRKNVQSMPHGSSRFSPFVIVSFAGLEFSVSVSYRVIIALALLRAVSTGGPMCEGFGDDIPYCASSERLFQV